FAAVAWLSLFPRPTPTHIVPAAPLLVAAPLFAARIAARRSTTLPASRGVRVAAAAAIALALAAPAWATIARLAHSHAAFPHQALIPVALKDATRLERSLTALHTATDGRVFIVLPNAGFLYLTGHLADPTPFDIPEHTDFGAHDELDAIRELKDDHV